MNQLELLQRQMANLIRDRDIAWTVQGLLNAFLIGVAVWAIFYCKCGG